MSKGSSRPSQVSTLWRRRIDALDPGDVYSGAVVARDADDVVAACLAEAERLGDGEGPVSELRRRGDEFE